MEKTESKESPVTSTNETVTDTSSPTSAATAFQPFQQLHEAVLAAVHSHAATFPTTFFSAAVAATNVNSTVPTTPQDNLTEAEKNKKESVRASNRERKKKWRLLNDERNKDNDLRCRVNKRANKVYGPNSSPAKEQWIKEEFEKRRQKRLAKEGKKQIVNTMLSEPTEGDMNGISQIGVQLHNAVNEAYYAPLPQIDTETAAKLLDFPTELQRQLLEQLNSNMLALTNSIQQQATQTEDMNKSTPEDVDMETATQTEESIIQTEESNTQAKENASQTNENKADVTEQPATHELSSSASTAENSSHDSPMEVDDNQDQKPTEKDTNKDKKPEYPMDAVLTLMQLNAGWRE